MNFIQKLVRKSSIVNVTNLVVHNTHYATTRLLLTRASIKQWEQPKILASAPT